MCGGIVVYFFQVGLLMADFSRTMSQRRRVSTERTTPMALHETGEICLLGVPTIKNRRQDTETLKIGCMKAKVLLECVYLLVRQTVSRNQIWATNEI